MSKLDDLYAMCRREGDYDPAEDLLRDPVCRRVIAVVPDEIEARDAEIARLTAENKDIRWKALRFDLDAASIEERERNSVELVELRAVVERLRACMTTAGLECFISTGTPEQIAEHMRAVAKSCTAELAAIRERCERLAAEVKAWRQYDESLHICQDVEGDVCSGCIFYRATTDTGKDVDAHNDLTDQTNAAQPQRDWHATQDRMHQRPRL